MIYITKEQAHKVKYLLEQAMQGNHILFEPGTLCRILEDPPTLPESHEAAEPHIEKVMSLETVPEQRAYLERLDPKTFELVVRTYIHIVDNTLSEVKKVTH